MNILIKDATIVAPGTGLDGKTTDILTEGGVITQLKKGISPKTNAKVIQAPELCVSAGWLDLQTVSCDPGYEHKETLETMMECAAAGGFTGVCVHSYSQPALHTKSQIEYLVNKSRNKIVDVFPIGTVTQEGKGKDVSEMYDMKLSGAMAFSDHKLPIKDAGTVMRAIQYATNAGSFIITHCNEQSLSHGGQMNEGEVSTSLGLKGIPAIAEELMLERNISILEYAGGKLHIPTISTQGSVDLMKKAKASGLNITCGVAAVNLLLDDSSLKEFDTNYKLDPPLRTKRDVQALRNGIENGVIDVIVSDHLPQDTESKELEFDHADVGIINLQTAFSCSLEGLKKKNISAIVKCLTTNPRNILGVAQPEIAEGASANLTIFTTAETSALSQKKNNSKSRNSPFFDQELQGSVIGIINGAKSYFN